MIFSGPDHSPGLLCSPRSLTSWCPPRSPFTLTRFQQVTTSAPRFPQRPAGQHLPHWPASPAQTHPCRIQAITVSDLAHTSTQRTLRHVPRSGQKESPSSVSKATLLPPSLVSTTPSPRRAPGHHSSTCVFPRHLTFTKLGQFY